MATSEEGLPQDLLVGLRRAAEVFADRKIRYDLIWGIAAGYRSRPRFTQDLDFLLEIPQVELPGLLDELSKREFDFDPSKTIREWAQDHLTILSFHGLRVDWLKPVLPLYQHVIDGSTEENIAGTAVKMAAPEGLILSKLLAFRTRDQEDIESILAAHRGRLDLDFIAKEWQTVGSTQDEVYQRFLDMVAESYSPAAPQP